MTCTQALHALRRIPNSPWVVQLMRPSVEGALILISSHLGRLCKISFKCLVGPAETMPPSNSSIIGVTGIISERLGMSLQTKASPYPQRHHCQSWPAIWEPARALWLKLNYTT